MSDNWLQAGIALGIGLGLGWFYFGALWTTVKRMVKKASVPYAAATLTLSTLVRLALALAVFYWLASLSIASLIMGVIGFTLVAILLTAKRATSGA